MRKCFTPLSLISLLRLTTIRSLQYRARLALLNLPEVELTAAKAAVRLGVNLLDPTLEAIRALFAIFRARLEAAVHDAAAGEEGDDDDEGEGESSGRVNVSLCLHLAYDLQNDLNAQPLPPPPAPLPPPPATPSPLPSRSSTPSRSASYTRFSCTGEEAAEEEAQG